MKFRIHGTVKGTDYEDSVVIEGATITEIRELADQHTRSRSWDADSCWSEEVKEQPQDE